MFILFFFYYIHSLKAIILFYEIFKTVQLFSPLTITPNLIVNVRKKPLPSLNRLILE